MNEMSPAPAIVVVNSDAAKQIMLVVEKEILLECCDMTTAVVDLMSAFFTFDIAYPKPLNRLCLFIQHFILGIIDDQPLPNAITILYTSMDKV